MQIEPGQTLQHYRIVDKIGAGGMGVVWRAVDTTLDREVAIKVLPAGLAADPERLARFEREAKLLAAVNHPNIAEIYGLHTVGETRFIAMELVAGEDLAQRIGRGALPPNEVLGIAKQIARALEVAHEQGVIHRDLKPANVQVTTDGRVKVLDFGLAKALQPDLASSETPPSMSPTVTSLGTQAGMILGTAAYMSPEQARGHAADKRADIWALGCTLFEMLTGRPIFAGDTVSDTLAAVLKSEPDWDALPSDLDPALRLLLERCLDKDVRERMRDVGEVRIAVERMLSGKPAGFTASGVMLPGTTAADAGKRKPVAGGWPGVAALLALTAAIAGGAAWWLSPDETTDEPVLRRFEIMAPGLRFGNIFAPRLSPDGLRVAYPAGEDDSVWVRDLDQLEPREVPGSENARHLMWSPDGEQVGWQSGNKIWRAAVDGGSKISICDTATRITATAWGPDDRILLTPDAGPIYEVSARGGDPRPLLEPVKGQDKDFHTASFLPGGRGLIYSVHRADQGQADTLEVLVDGARKEILRIEDHWLVWPEVSEDGYLIYRRGGGNDGLWAAPFSLERLELTGEPVLIDPDGTVPSISRDGSLLYARSSAESERQLVRVDREGRQTETLGQPQGGMDWPSLSPDGRTVAVSAESGEGEFIWLHDTVRGSRTRLTFDREDEWAPAWYPDGTRLAFGRGYGGAARILTLATDGSGEAVEIATGMIADVAADGSTVAFERNFPETDDDLFYVSGEGGADAALFLSTDQGEEHVQFSPDGEFLAYTSEDSGRDEVFLKRFPSAEGRWQISVDGGNWPRWNPAGGELFYLGDGRMMVVDVELGDSPRIGTPREIFSLEAGGYRDSLRPYDVAPDGQSFVMLHAVGEEAGVAKLTFVENWVRVLE